MKNKKPLLPEEEDSNRAKVNPFERDDEKDGVDLKDDESERNSFLDDDDEEFPDEDDIEDAIGDDNDWL